MTMNYNRYDTVDNYILAEIEFEYLSADRRGKLDILKKIYLDSKNTKYEIPYELAKLFIEKADDNILLWLAKNGGNFDYRDRDHSSKEPAPVYEHPDRNLWEIFENHENDFVKAAIYENCDYDSGECVFYRLNEELKELNHLQRLALIRNKFNSPFKLLVIAKNLFEKNQDLQFLSTDEKNELRRAILTNQSLIDYTHNIINDDIGGYEIKDDLNKLWQSIYGCDDYKSKEIAFRLLGGFDKTKASIYRKLLTSMIKTDNDESSPMNSSLINYENDSLKYNIILNCSIKDSVTLLLGTQDQDRYINNLATSKYIPKNVKNTEYYFKTFYPSVLYEIIKIIVVIILVSQFKEVQQLLLICAVIYTYVMLNYKSISTLISNTRQSLVLLTNIKLTAMKKEEIAKTDRDLMSASDVLQVTTIKLYIMAISTTLIGIYLIYKFATAII